MSSLGRLIIILVFFVCSDWFKPTKTETQLLQVELGAERQLRKLAETKLRASELARKKAERERDLYRVRCLQIVNSNGLYIEDLTFLLDDDAANSKLS